MYGDLVVVPIPAELQEGDGGDGDGAAGAGVRSAPGAGLPPREPPRGALTIAPHLHTYTFTPF